MPHDFLNKNFKSFRESLLSYSGKFKASYEVREEMVNDTILTALNSFDHDKGSFEGYCKVILKNKLLNFTKDKKELSFLITLDDYEEILPAPEITIESGENLKSIKMFFERLKNELKPDELIVFNEIYNTCNDLNKINISKVSGIEADKAWNIFRKIQTKANKLYKKLKADNVELLFTLEKLSEHSDGNQILFQKDTRIIDKNIDTDNFNSKLTEDQIIKINSIYNDSSPDKHLTEKPLSFFKKYFPKNTK